MIEFLSSWIKDIVYIMVFIVFLEMLLPSNSMRKYVNVVAGLLIMLVILTPITSVISRRVNIEDVMSRYYVDMNQIEVKNQNELTEGQKDITIKVYKNKIEKQMKDQIEKNLEEVEVAINVKVFEKRQEENYGEIKEVNIYLDKRDDSITKIKPIETIEFGEQEDKEIENKNSEESIINKEEEKTIKELIFDFYNVPLKNIYITKQKIS